MELLYICPLEVVVNTKAPPMLNVLIVDDDEDDRALFCDAVSEINPSISCLTAQNGEEALDALRSFRFPRPDIIFLDLNMPRLSGMDCLTELKNDDLLKEIPAFIYSTSCFDRDIMVAINSGAENFIIKPLYFNELRNALKFIFTSHAIEVCYKD
jgi:CheY-like chemotaxis protein